MHPNSSFRLLTLLSSLFLGLTMVCAFAQGSKPVTVNGAATGIILNAYIRPSFNAGRPEIECEIINATPSPVDYDAWLVPIGFDFHLRDAQGLEVAMNERWFMNNSPRYKEYTKTRTLKILPGNKVSYTLRLDEAFGPAWKRGVKLEVGWFQQGSDNEKPTISTEVLLPMAKLSSFQIPEEQNIKKADTNTTPQLPVTTKPPPTTGMKPTVSNKQVVPTQWLVWILVVLSVIGLLWLSLKNWK